MPYRVFRGELMNMPGLYDDKKEHLKTYIALLNNTKETLGPAASPGPGPSPPAPASSPASSSSAAVFPDPGASPDADPAHVALCLLHNTKGRD